MHSPFTANKVCKYEIVFHTPIDNCPFDPVLSNMFDSAKEAYDWYKELYCYEEFKNLRVDFNVVFGYDITIDRLDSESFGFVIHNKRTFNDDEFYREFIKS